MAKSKFKELLKCFRIPERCCELLNNAGRSGWSRRDFREWWKRIDDKRNRRIIKNIWRAQIREYLKNSPCDERLRTSIFRLLKDSPDGPHLGNLREDIKRVHTAYNLWCLRRELGSFDSFEFSHWWEFVTPVGIQLMVAFNWYRKTKRQAKEDQKNRVPSVLPPDWEKALLANI